MRRNIGLLAICMLIGFFAFAQHAIKERIADNEYLFSVPKGKIRISFCSASMFRVRYSANGEFEANEPWMVVKYDWPGVSLTYYQTSNDYLIETSLLKLRLNKQSSCLEVTTKDGELVCSEDISGDPGGIFKRGDTILCVKSTSPGEHFFGLGERMDFLDRSNKELNLNVGRGRDRNNLTGAYNILEANYCPIPFFMSTNGYGIFFHNAFPTGWNMRARDDIAYGFEAAGGEMDYYFIYGPKFSSILNSYTSLTGRSPLLPNFAYGLHLGTYSGGTWGYEQLTSDHYVIELARKLRAMGIPVDLLWLDSTWRIFGTDGGRGATSFEWRETFADPKKMFDSLYAMHFAMVGLHLRPRFDNGKKIKLLDTAQQLKYTYPEKNFAGDFVNFFDSASVNFWWKHGVMRVASIGARFLKTDEGSAFGGLANESDKTGPQGKEIKKLHNLFPIAYAKAPYEKFQQYNGIRGLNQTREGYAGIQRYPYIFAGDWPSEWQYFAPVIKAGLNIGLSGVSNWAHCMGGFEHPADPELYMRWVQFGMFSPVALVFGMDHPGYKEPWSYGEDALKNFRKYDSIRYRLLPYIYTNAFSSYQTGMPLMRALVLSNQYDENTYEIGDQYMFGGALMICPVTTKGALTRTVYLPEGEWYDYWTGKRYNGHQYIITTCPIDTIPIYAKSGSIIPMQQKMNYVGEQPAEELTVDIFPGWESQFDLYEDDGRSLNYQNGEYAITRMNVAGQQNIKITIGKPEGKFKPVTHHYILRVRSQARPSAVMESATMLPASEDLKIGSWTYNEKEKIIYINLQKEETYSIEIKH